MRRRLALLAGTLLALAAAAPSPAGAARVPCLPDGAGPSCRVWTGTVLAVNDGDTFRVDLDGDGRRRGVDVRFAGVQAMELTVHHPDPRKRRDECHGIEAAARVEALVRGSRRRVRLTAQHASSRSDRRLARHVAVRRDGRWQDVGAILMAEGHALFLANPKEPAWNLRYDELSQHAALDGRGVWDPLHCGAGPAQDIPLRIWANWNPPGVDNLDLNGEWTKVRNDSPDRAVSLAGWWIRDSMQRRFTLPAGTVLAPGRTLTLHTGSGPNGGLTFHWGLGVTLYPNPEDGGEGDGAFLFDPQGDLRAAMTYPCLVACGHADAGTLTLAADPRGSETVTVRNVAGRAVDLADKVLVVNAGFAFPFGDGVVLRPGEELELDLAGDLGMDRPIMRDAGGSVRVATFRDITLACDAWGSGSCP
jgi:endonuclease YncB( thermonuclease family)